jgi:hypothetical protein
VIKRYFNYNKNIFLSHRFQYPTKVSSEKNVTYLELRAYLGQKKSVTQIYLFITISFYRIIMCQNVSFEEGLNDTPKVVNGDLKLTILLC